MKHMKHILLPLAALNIVMAALSFKEAVETASILFLSSSVICLFASLYVLGTWAKDDN